MSFQYDMES